MAHPYGVYHAEPVDDPQVPPRDGEWIKGSDLPEQPWVLDDSPLISEHPGPRTSAVTNAGGDEPIPPGDKEANAGDMGVNEPAAESSGITSTADLSTGAKPESLEMPAKNASAASWRAYAVDQGTDSAVADSMTRDELATFYTSEE